MELPDPVAAADGLLVRVKAASINPYDFVAAGGATQSFAETRLPFIPGVDGAGVVEAVGADVADFAVGDEVIANAGGKSYWGGGTFAELVDVPASAAVKKPASLSFIDAASIPQTGLTGLAAVEVLEAAAGDVVAAIGATGGVGSWFTQIAASRGARVVALVRPDTFDYARSLGAAAAVDYTAPDLVDQLHAIAPTGLDGLADFAGNKELIDTIAPLVRPGGRAASSILKLEPADFPNPDVFTSRSNKLPFSRMPDLLALLDAGQIRPVETRVVPFEALGDALAAVGEKRGRGKVVVRIAD
jgi:NADPH:quinone reductase-like Zn-dependent oxidoreductase